MYTGIFLGEDQPNGGMIEMNDEWPAEIPPHWMTYFTVDDVDAAAAKVTDLGGSISVPPQDIPVGRFSVVNDPQGGVFTIYKPGAQLRRISTIRELRTPPGSLPGGALSFDLGSGHPSSVIPASTFPSPTASSQSARGTLRPCAPVASL